MTNLRLLPAVVVAVVCRTHGRHRPGRHAGSPRQLGECRVHVRRAGHVPVEPDPVQRTDYRRRQGWPGDRASVSRKGNGHNVVEAEGLLEAVERRQDGLVDLEREVRRDRCTAEEMEQLEQRRWYLVIGEQDEAARPSRCPKQTLVENAEHRRKYNAMLEAAKEAYTFEKTPSFTKMIRESAQWVDAHVPAHDSGEIAINGLESSARQFYSYGSSFIHGYKWMTEYSRSGNAFPMIADTLAVTLNMAERAVCLFEAASRAPGGARPKGSHLPKRFEPTVAAWSVELFSS
jgi:hypothetical protein